MIRTITDPEGTQWEVTTGSESYGMQVLLFFPMDGGGVRKAMLGTNTRLEADYELAAFDEAGLRERLHASVAWEENILSSR